MLTPEPGSACAAMVPMPDRSPASLVHAVEGTLKGFDQLLNLVLDEATEFLRGASLISPFRPRAAGCGAVGPTPSESRAPFSCPGAADPEDPQRVTDESRKLGLVVCRGTSVTVVSPTAGTEEIANPFIAPEDQ